MDLNKKLNHLLASGKAFRSSKDTVCVPMGKYMGMYLVSPAESLGDKETITPYISGYPKEPGKISTWVSPATLTFRFKKRKARWGQPSVADFRNKAKENRAIYDAWGATQVPKFYREMKFHTQSVSESSGIRESVIEWLLFLTGTRVFQAYSEHPVRFTENFKRLDGGMLFSLPIQLRWRLVLLCYRMSWKKAIRVLFPKTHPQFFNSCETLQSFLRHVKTGIAHRAKEEGDAESHSQWQHNRDVFSHTLTTKEQYLNYFRRWKEDGTRNLTEYFRELRRAKEEGRAALPDDWGFTLVEPDEAHRRHEGITRLVMEANAENRDNPEVLEAHKKNWSQVSAPPAGWKPLLTCKDFVLEGKLQHHCVGSYYASTESLFVHIEHKGEIATLQWDFIKPQYLGTDQRNRCQVRQIFGACNKQVSGEMRDHVNKVLAELIQNKTHSTHSLLSKDDPLDGSGPPGAV